jgi:microcystin-dependent protein
MPNPTANPQFLPPNLAEFMSRRMRDVAANINCCLIGTITAINANGTITASVNFQKVIKGVLPLPNNQGIADQVVNYPALVNVPVFIYQGGGAAILMPLKVGDTCLLLFCDRDMDVWFETAQIGPPNSDRVHNINDAIALVGINNIMSLFPPNTSGVIQIFDVTGERLAQSGMMVAYGGASAPNGWLLCQGQAVSRSTYANLFAVIGTIYGSGNGSTTFNLPNMQGQVAVGFKSGDPDFGTLGAEVGSETVTLTIANLPSAGDYPLSYSANGQFGSDALVVDSAEGGSSTPVNIVQPSLVVNWIIKI